MSSQAYDISSLPYNAVKRARSNIVRKAEEHHMRSKERLFFLLARLVEALFLTLRILYIGIEPTEVSAGPRAAMAVHVQYSNEKFVVLLLTKANSFFNSNGKFLVEYLIRLVRW